VTAAPASSGAALAALAGRASCSAICDAMMRLHDHRAHVVGLVSPCPERRLLGPAVTMRFLPLRRDRLEPARHDFEALLLEAVADEPEGRVLVASSGGHPEAALAGGRKLSRLRNLGLAGILADGRLRDFADVAALGIAAWCRGETVRQAGDLLMPFAANVPVALGGVAVFPGDWIYADAAGAVVMPVADVRAVLEEAVRTDERDAATVARVRDEDRARLAARTSPPGD
jgi:4-hydroxy-4-methyl-2-oxoglutarate aldolase